MDTNNRDLKSEIISLHKELRENINLKWNRVLPFNEEFTDRWEKAQYLGFGEDSSIYDSSAIIGKVSVGKNKPQ